MYPDEFVDEGKIVEKRKRLEHKVALFFGFVSSVFFLGPLIHELGHISVLVLEGCSFNTEFGFSLLGFHGAIQPLCDLSSAWLLFFYSSGYLAQIVLGGILCLYSVDIRENDFLSYITAVVGVGLLISVLFSIGDHGDVYLFLDVLGFPEALGHVVTLFLALGVSATCLRVLEVVFRQQEK